MKIENHLANKVLIIVRGGSIQGIFCSDRNLTVDILDYDEEQFLDDQSAKAEFETKSKSLFELSMS